MNTRKLTFLCSAYAMRLYVMYGSRLSSHLTDLKKYSHSASVYRRPCNGVVGAGGGVGDREGVSEKRTRWRARECVRARDRLDRLPDAGFERDDGRVREVVRAVLVGFVCLRVVRPLGGDGSRSSAFESITEMQ